jgi:hypothetical protein
MRRNHICRQFPANGNVLAFAVLTVNSANAQPNSGEPQWLSTGEIITPLAPNGARS